MIKIRLKGVPGRVRGFTVWGHAHFADPGQDIVCAGVSALVTTALIGLKKHVPGKMSWRILPQGLIHCRLADDLTEEESRVAGLILDTMVLGCIAVRADFTKYISITFRR